MGLGWLMATLALGFVFVAWAIPKRGRQLAAQGLYLATNPNSSFYYVFYGDARIACARRNRRACFGDRTN